MLRGVTDEQRASSAETGVDSDIDCRRGSGLASWLDPSPPVLAFGIQNVIALLVELRRRERLTAWRCGAWIPCAPWPSTGAQQDPAANTSPAAPVPATDCKEQP